MIERLLPGAHVLTRPRLSQLSFAGEKKLTRLPRRSAIVAFSADEVYEVAELIRRQRGGAAVVMGALSPRTRMRRSSSTSPATSNISLPPMPSHGLNSMSITSPLRPPEVRRLPVPQAQSGGARTDCRPRRPRHPQWQLRHHRPMPAVRDRPCPGAREPHFEPIKVLQWRNTALEFTSIGALQASLAERRRTMVSPARRSARISWCSSMPRATTTSVRSRHAGGGRAAVGRVPGSRLSQISPPPRRARDHALWVPDAEGAIPTIGSPARSTRPITPRRHRHALEPYRPHSHLDLRRNVRIGSLTPSTGRASPTRWRTSCRMLARAPYRTLR